jgi:predicted ATP-dependent endonuclease of OLD family
MNRYYSDVFLKINGVRNVYSANFEPMLMWEHLFYKHSASDVLEIEISFEDSNEEKLTFQKQSLLDNAFTMGKSVVGGKHQIQKTTDGYILNMESSSSSDTIKSIFKIENNTVYLENSDFRQSSNIVPSLFIDAQSLNSQQLAEWFSRVDYEGGKNKCIEILKEIDSRVEDISILVVGGLSYIYITTKENVKVPVSFLGDGINRLLQITLAMMANPNSLILINEIETGFHYTFLNKLWRVISKTVLLTGCQLVTTTHSIECVNALAECVDTGESDDMFRYMRLDFVEGKVVPKVFENDVFVTALQNNIEV